MPDNIESEGTGSQPESTPSQPTPEVVANPNNQSPRDHFISQFQEEGLNEAQLARLTEFYDRQNADYTRKTQEVATKFQQFQEMLKDPNKVQALMKLYGTELPEQQQQQQAQEPEPRPHVDYNEVLEPAAIPALQALVVEQIQAAVKQLGVENLPDRLKVLDTLQQDRAHQEWNRVVGKYPAAKSIESDPLKMQQLQNLIGAGGLSLDQAVMALVGDEIVSQQKAQALRPTAPAESEPAQARQQHTPLMRQSAPVSQVSGPRSFRNEIAEAIRQAQRN